MSDGRRAAAGRPRQEGWSLPAADEGRWLLLYLVARSCALVVALGLVLWRGPSRADVLGVLYGVVSTGLLATYPRVRRERAVWAADIGIVLVLIVVSNDWRSAFYLLWLTTLVLPSTRIWGSPALWAGGLASVAYLVVAFVGGPSPGSLGPVSSETLAIHVCLPFFTVVFTAYAAEAMRRLRGERRARERLAIEAERRRIAWELHDSAKQRVHAAHLIVSSLAPRVPADLAMPVQRAVAELESTVSDMDTSLAELRSPLEGRPLHQALAQRVAELDGTADAKVDVAGAAPDLPPLVAAHAYRIACEALTNALRHADAQHIVIRIAARDGRLRLTVVDDGVGMPAQRRPGSSGLLAMESRAATIGGTLSITPGDDDAGTRVELALPIRPSEGART